MQVYDFSMICSENVYYIYKDLGMILPVAVLSNMNLFELTFFLHH